MIDKKKLDQITDFLKWKIFRNMDIMYLDDPPAVELDKSFIDKYHGEIKYAELVDIIASLHNLLYEAVTGERYDYMFHWTNKIGSDCFDDIFDHDIFESEAENE